MFEYGQHLLPARRRQLAARKEEVLAILAPLAAKVLQMSISRQREYLADATAAEFTRNPLGLASALSKISRGGASVPGENRGTQHLFIINPVSNFTATASELMSTHPATELRIKRLQAMAGLEQRKKNGRPE